MQRGYLLLLLIGWCAFVHATNQVTLSTTDGAPGDTVTLTASLANTDPVSAIEVVVPIGEHISYVQESAVLNSARNNGHTLSASQVGNELRVYIYSISLQTLQGNEGELFSCNLVLSDEPIVQNITPTIVLSDATGTIISSTATPALLTILAPKMEVQTPAIDYGHIPIRATYTKPLTIRNVGTVPLTISAIDFSADEFSHATLPLVIAAGGSQSVTLTYAPTQRGAIQESAVITSDAVNGQFVAVKTVSLVADPFSVNELHVGKISGIANDTVSVHLTMNNMEPIVAGEVSFKLPKQLIAVSDGFTLSSRASDHQTMMRTHGDTVTYYFYSPSNSPLADNDGTIGAVHLLIDGSSSTYTLTPKNVVLANATGENMVSATSNGSVQAKSPRISASTTLSLPYTSVTDTALATFAIRNQGAAPLTIHQVSFLQEGFSCVSSLPISLNAGGSGTIEVRYIPTKEGVYNTTMQIYSNDPAERMHSVSVSSSIYEPNQLTVSGQVENNEYVLCVDLQNYSDVTAIQFDIQGLPATGVRITPSSRLSQHTVMLTPMEDSYRAIVYSMTNSSISDHSGEILQIIFPIAGLSSLTATISNMVISSIDGKNKNSGESVQWKVQLPDAPTTTPSLVTSNISNQHFIKVIKNNQLLILNNEKLFNALGGRVR